MTPTHNDIREYLSIELKKDLVGPAKEDEELTESPLSHYLTGILYPPDTEIDPEEDQDSAEAVDQEDDEIDTGTRMAAATNPSAIGLTFTVKRGEEIKIITKAAIYINVEDTTRSWQNWQRKQLQIQLLYLTIKNDEIRNEEISTGLRLFIRVRTRNKFCVVTVSLINVHTQTSDIRPDNFCFFQPEIKIESNDPGKPVFLPRYTRESVMEDPDRALNNLLYRHVPEYSVGHGCAVEWEAEEGNNATVLTTSIIPSYEAEIISPDIYEPKKYQEMLFLSEANKDELISELRKLQNDYHDWISRLDTTNIPDYLQNLAEENINECRRAAKRIENGITLLETDIKVRQAFQMTNQAMLIQRARVTWLKTDESERVDEPNLSDEHRWYPFQLAFILLCISSISDPGNEYRSIVDLLWFPTGGGKTEAYLGLIAFTIFLRRLRNNGEKISAGVTAMMRYTLRLLTIQQFQRASSLIMACEYIRRRKINLLGNSAISAGLWVGAGATPNTLRAARNSLDKLLQGERVLEGNPYQIHSCPWCGSGITPRHYRIGATMVIHCPNEGCEFSEGIPLYLVDEDIYNRTPSLIIGTVDKFARLPWVSNSGAIFGRPDGEHFPPELIIQDELHLISGPLGSLTGLYETAIDILCTQNGNPPKIIASTATIRRAEEQSRDLFNRGFSQFPPPGLDARDNYFSKQIPSSELPGRLFTGIHAPGRSMKTALLRICANLLQNIYEHSADEELRDPYWTLIAYFNSIRELGGAVRLVEDDIPDRILLIARREGNKRRYINYYRELNSRIGSDEIPEILEDMDRTMEDRSALDVLLTSNMISVGVDVDRLGLMVVTGQPKMTSEYIQATSRIGRKYPGQVITLYNWTRPRDRSHYERFIGYHSTLYSQVEPTSVTPFSSRARDKGLHGVFITLIRHLMPEMNPEDGAVKFDPASPIISRIAELILERINSIDPSEVNDARNELESIINRWRSLASADRLVYSKPRKESARYLMIPAEKANLAEPLVFPTLNSLRDVEGEAKIFFRK